jgi:hypothetical protein
MSEQAWWWGYSNLWGELSSDRLPWFVCEKLELNTKSPPCFYVRAQVLSAAIHPPPDDALAGMGGGP